MKLFRDLPASPGAWGPCALTIGNFDGVHRGHQAMLALLRSQAQHRGLSTCVLSFDPHPREYFARRQGQADRAPLRITPRRDKLRELARCGVDRVVALRFNAGLAALTPEAFIEQVVVQGLQARFVLVGDDFRFGAHRAGDYALLDRAGAHHGFEVARMTSYEVQGQRVSSSALRRALADGDMARVARDLGRPYSLSGHVMRGQQLGRTLGFRTLNVALPGGRCAAQGIFVVRVLGLGPTPLPGVASLGVRPTVSAQGAQWLETHCLHWPEHLGPEGGYGHCIQVELLHRLHEERHYPSLAVLQHAIAQDTADARRWWAAQGVDTHQPD